MCQITPAKDDRGAHGRGLCRYTGSATMVLCMVMSFICSIVAPGTITAENVEMHTILFPTMIYFSPKPHVGPA